MEGCILAPPTSPVWWNLHSIAYTTRSGSGTAAGGHWSPFGPCCPLSPLASFSQRLKPLVSIYFIPKLSLSPSHPILKWSEVTQSCPILCDPMDCSLPGSSIHGIFQARILEWVATFLLQQIFLTQELNLGLPHCRQMLYHLSHKGGPGAILRHPKLGIGSAYPFCLEWGWLPGWHHHRALVPTSVTGTIFAPPPISVGEGNDNPLQYPCLANSMDRGAWQATFHGIAKSPTRLSDFTPITVAVDWPICWNHHNPTMPELPLKRKRPRGKGQMGSRLSPLTSKCVPCSPKPRLRQTFVSHLQSLVYSPDRESTAWHLGD